MPISITRLADETNSGNTILLFGSGSSIPSGAPSVEKIIRECADLINVDATNYSLGEITGIVEHKKGRKHLVNKIRSLFSKIKPTGGLLNIPLFEWKNIYTTNYDELVENSYKRANKPLSIYSSDFDFTVHETPEATKLFKLHGTLGADICDGHKGRLILTDYDNDLTEDYREKLYDHFRNDLNGSHLIIIGHSLADSDIKTLINRANSINLKIGAIGKISLLMHTQDDALADLHENRGIKVCFGGIDQFFAELSKKSPESKLVYRSSSDPIDRVPALRPITIDVSHEVSTFESNFSAMFNGWPARYADIANSLTFARTVTTKIDEFFKNATSIYALILGAAGVGKTTSSRQVLFNLNREGHLCWEHKDDHTLLCDLWATVAKTLKEQRKFGILFIDDTHRHLRELNDLIDRLTSDENFHLKILMASSSNHWNHRVKTPNIFKYGKQFNISKLQPVEISNLINLIETSKKIQPLVEQSFGGFSRHEQRRRLTVRCDADFFVCLKNIFASEKLDDIILREYAGLEDEYRDIYRFVAAMESAGIRVHRQLVMRVLGISAESIAGTLSRLEDIIHEYSISERDGIYGWKGRHSIIVNIITKFKFSDKERFYELLEKVIENISPTYEIEIRTIRELCNFEHGISKIPNKKKQNTLLQKMISIAPGERVPRHRLIRNLIDMGEFEKAETEIRLFDNDLRFDGPVQRYRILLLVARASQSKGLMDEDRLVILEEAHSLAQACISRYPDNKNMLEAYCDVGLQFFKLNGKLDVYDNAIKVMKKAELRIGDPEITRSISRYERRVSGMTTAA